MASYKLNFQYWQHWKCLIPRGPFKCCIHSVAFYSFEACIAYSFYLVEAGIAKMITSFKWIQNSPELCSASFLNDNLRFFYIIQVEAEYISITISVVKQIFFYANQETKVFFQS